MNYALPLNFEHVGVAPFKSVQETSPLLELFEASTQLHKAYMFSAKHFNESFQHGMFGERSVTDEQRVNVLYMYNTMTAASYQLMEVNNNLGIAFNDSCKVNVLDLHELLYIELPINTNGEHLFAYIPAGVLTHEVTTDGTTWVYVGGIPSGSRVLVRNVWLTVQ